MVAKFEYSESKSTGSTPTRFRKISRALGVPPSLDDILMQGEPNRKLSLTNHSPTSTPSSRRRKISRAGERVADMVRSFSAQNMQVIWKINFSLLLVVLQTGSGQNTHLFQRHIITLSNL